MHHREGPCDSPLVDDDRLLSCLGLDGIFVISTVKRANVIRTDKTIQLLFVISAVVGSAPGFESSLSAGMFEAIILWGLVYVSYRSAAGLLKAPKGIDKWKHAALALASTLAVIGYHVYYALRTTYPCDFQRECQAGSLDPMLATIALGVYLIGQSRNLRRPAITDA